MQEEFTNLFIKHFSGETTENEDAALKELLLQNKSANEFYHSLKESWELSAHLKNSFDIERGYKIFKSKVNQREKFRIIFLRVAAVFIGLMLLSSLFYFDYTHTKTLYAENKVQQFILPDSSVVFLNKNSSLTYNSSMIWSFSRKVKLSGEAFFHVKKHNGKRFIVSVNELNVEVLGTQFNVRTHNNKSEIVLQEGKVKLYDNYAENNDIIMKPGDYVAYSEKEHRFSQSIVNTNLYTAWKEKKINFNNFNLDEVALIIKNVFNKEVIIKNKGLKNKHLSGSAPVDNLEILLTALSEIIGEDVILNNDTIIIK
jgi:ferric-dicitrate binding protein FerR (iron transport regulator)